MGKRGGLVVTASILEVEKCKMHQSEVILGFECRTFSLYEGIFLIYMGSLVFLVAPLSVCLEPFLLQPLTPFRRVAFSHVCHLTTYNCFSQVNLGFVILCLMPYTSLHYRRLLKCFLL